MNSTVHDISPEARLIHTIKITWQHGTQWVNGRSGWVNDMILVAKYLKELREKYPDDISFGAALNKTVDIPKNDRAALLGFAANLDYMRKVFEEIFPDRTSIRNMWDDPQTRQLYEKVDTKSRVRSRTTNTTTDRAARRGFKARREEVEESDEDQEQPHMPQQPQQNSSPAERAATERTAADRGFKVREEAKAPSSSPLGDLENYKRELKRKADAEVQAYKRKLDEEVQERLKVVREKEQYFDRLRKGQKGVYTPEEFRLIRSLLHPDRVTDEEMKKKYTAAFDLFNSRKFMLCSEVEEPKVSTTSFRNSYAAGKASYDAKEAARKARKAENDKARRAKNKAAKAAQAAAAAG